MVVPHTTRHTRHHRACPGDPELQAVEFIALDYRDKPGNDENKRLCRVVWGTTICCVQPLDTEQILHNQTPNRVQGHALTRSGVNHPDQAWRALAEP